MIRLLTRDSDGKLVLCKFDDHDIPAYAILSHTWNTDDNQEVTFDDDLNPDASEDKAGYRKIALCEEKAAAAGLRYFWIDTCCINKRSETELSEAINSMFRWYKKATRCYVYLSDVSASDDELSSPYTWQPAFRRSRWFTRGWTLQELIAPRAVEFFTQAGHRLGDKESLEIILQEVTGIDKMVLRGYSLSEFSVEERMSWAKHRSTKRPEDEFYSLLGIFNVSIPLIYGEGKENASRRLDDEIRKLSEAPGFNRYGVDISLSRLPEAVQLVGRGKELDEMHRILARQNSRSIAILHGLGGIGKTQLARQYIKRHKAKHTAVFWMNANDHDSLTLSFVGAARQILRQHPSAGAFASVDLEGDLNRVVNAVKAWLQISKNTRWLIIYDNYDNPKLPGHSGSYLVDISCFLPDSDHGAIIITTRSSQVTLGHRIHVQKLQDTQNGLEILSNTSRRNGIDKDPTAIALVEELDGLPLALATAGAYLEYMATSFSEYLRLYKASWLKLQMTSPHLSSYNRSLYTTWNLSYDQIKQQNESSSKLLKLWAYFDRQDLWFELLQHGRSQSLDWMRKLTEDELSFNNAIRILTSHGLVEPQLSSNVQLGSCGYSIHTCVHSWSIFMLNQEWDEAMAKLALTCIASAIPRRNDKKWWLLQQRLLQHVARCDELIANGKMNAKGLEEYFRRLGDLYRNQNKHDKAEAIYMRVLQGCTEGSGPKCMAILPTVHGLGRLYKDRGKLKEAEGMYMQALQGYEEILGPKHNLVLEAANNIGNLYRIQGKLKEAEAMHIRALQGLEEALGPKHTSTLDTVHNMGNLYADQGKLKEAEVIYMRALEGYEEVLGPKHTSTLDTVQSMGQLYADQGKLKKAEVMLMRALHGRKEALGPKHTSTLETVHNVSILYARQGKLKEAEAMYMQALLEYEEGPWC